MRLFKPLKGCQIFTSDKHMTQPAGELVGWCEKVDGNICIYLAAGSHETHRFIWRFNDGLNPWLEYSA